jgi:hypothetical protein
MQQPNLFSDLTEQEINDMLDKHWYDYKAREEEKKSECQCGSDKTYGRNNRAHSWWCPKYEKRV